MAKRYLRIRGEHFLWNGDQKLRVEERHRFKDPKTGRVLKIFAVKQILSMPENTDNPIEHDTMLAISFPEEKANARRYEWSKDEQFQATIKVHLLRGPPPIQTYKLN